MKPESITLSFDNSEVFAFNNEQTFTFNTVFNHAKALAQFIEQKTGPFKAKGLTVLAVTANHSIETITFLIAAAYTKSAILLLSPRNNHSINNSIAHKYNSSAFVYKDTRTSRTAIEFLLEKDHKQWSYTDIVESHKSIPNISLKVQMTQPFTIIFTSGSSGKPKAIIHTIGNHFYSALGSSKNIPFEKQDCWLASLPFYHVGGIAVLMKALFTGASVFLPDSPGALKKTLNMADKKITHISLVPAQLHDLLQDDITSRTLAQMKSILIGGAPLEPVIAAKAKKLNLKLIKSYGNTEMSSQVSATRPGEDINVHSGKPLPFREVAIKNHEIVTRGLTLAKHLNSDHNITDLKENDGWYHTRDTGYFDKSGNLVITGRLDNMFISGGENIQPEEIETVIYQHPDVIQTVVLPVPHNKYGERPVALLKTEGHFDKTVNEIKEILGRQLPRFKIPDAFIPWPQSFKQESLKIDRKQAARYLEQVKTEPEVE